jgi:cytochrome b561
MFITIAVFARVRGITIFSIHPLCMTVGTIIFICEGIVAYRSRALVETLSPIMQHSKRVKVRTLHQTLQMIGTSFLGLGLLFIVAHKAEYKKSIMPQTIHSSIGIIAISLIVVQIIIGNQKISHLDRSNTKIKRWHGDCGLLVWDLLCITLITGLIEFLPFSFFTIFVVFIIVILWVSTHAQMKRQNPDGAGNSSSIPFSASTNDMLENEDLNESFVEVQERTA